MRGEAPYECGRGGAVGSNNTVDDINWMGDAGGYIARRDGEETEIIPHCCSEADEGEDGDERVVEVHFEVCLCRRSGLRRGLYVRAMMVYGERNRFMKICKKVLNGNAEI